MECSGAFGSEAEDNGAERLEAESRIMEWSGAIGSGAEDNGPKHLVAERRIMERSGAERLEAMQSGG